METEARAAGMTTRNVDKRRTTAASSNAEEDNRSKKRHTVGTKGVQKRSEENGERSY